MHVKEIAYVAFHRRTRIHVRYTHWHDVLDRARSFFDLQGSIVGAIVVWRTSGRAQVGPW